MSFVTFIRYSASSEWFDKIRQRSDTKSNNWLDFDCEWRMLATSVIHDRWIFTHITNKTLENFIENIGQIAVPGTFLEYNNTSKCMSNCAYSHKPEHSTLQVWISVMIINLQCTFFPNSQWFASKNLFLFLKNTQDAQWLEFVFQNEEKETRLKMNNQILAEYAECGKATYVEQNPIYA